MRPLRVGRWTSQIRPLGHRVYAVPEAFNGSYRPQLRSLSTTQDLGMEQFVLPKRRGRPPKHLTPLQSRTAPSSASVGAGGVAHMPPTTASTGNGSTSQSTSDAFASEPLRLEDLPSPHPHAARSSAKLAALHARLSLSSRVPIEVLGRALIHPTADPDRTFNNYGLSILGQDLLQYYMLEHLFAKYPRLPTVVLSAAQNAFIGNKALNTMASEWGVEAAAAPGGEVDSGLLQFKRAPLVTGMDEREQKVIVQPAPRESDEDKSATLEQASSSFVRATFGAVYAHCGAAATYEMFRNHILSRDLDLSKLFTFKQPTRDLSRLCAREGFQSPVARLESETGRLSRHPVFVVAVYSGRDKLGEGVGGSLDEARFRAAVSALKGWYLYTPHGEVVVPSQAGADGQAFTPLMVDIGEIVA